MEHARTGPQLASLLKMPRKKLILTSKAPYHVVNRSNNKELFYLPLQKLWPIFIENLKKIETHFNCEIHAFVLMNNHYHLIISTPDNNLGEAMKYLHREIARRANWKAKRINHFFGGRYKWSLIYEEIYYWNAVKYVLRNPVKAGISDRVENYPYSSFGMGKGDYRWKMVDFFHDKDKLIELDTTWLNENFKDDHEDLIKLALRRREFKIPTSKNGHLENLEVWIFNE